METSDSEYFESADEELYDEGFEESKMAVKLMKEHFKNVQISVKTGDTNLTVTSKDICDVKVDDVEENSPENKTTQVPEKIEIKGGNYEKVTTQLKEVKGTEGCNQLSVQEVLKHINFEPTTEVESNENTFLKQPSEVIQKQEESDNKLYDKNKGNVVEVDENLWEGDGWEIEEEIVPNVATEKLTRKNSTENMWDNQESEDIINIQPQLTQNANLKKEDGNKIDEQSSTGNDSWSSWGNWGVTSLLSSATQSMSTIKNRVSEGFSNVLETGMGIPSAEELAKMNCEEEKKSKEAVDKSDMAHMNVETNVQGNSAGFVFGNLGNLVSGVSNITKFVETTGTKVISGGLETLETIGKKTIEVLQEGDPGLKKKRAFLKLEQEKPVLSQVLREAKERSEQESIERCNQIDPIIKKVNYEALFDDYHGLVHLEALEMLSKQCELKLKTLCDNCSEEALIDIQETMDQIKDLCELPDEDEDELLTLEEIKEKLQSAIEDINVNVTYTKLITSWEETESWLDTVKINICSEEELHQQAIETLAQLTALVVEQYHKAGELLLIKEHHSTADEADSLVQLTTTLTSLIGIVAAKFSDKLNHMLSSKGQSSKENINNLITNVFFEASNSSSYIQDAFQLLIPVLQIGAI